MEERGRKEEEEQGGVIVDLRLRENIVAFAFGRGTEAERDETARRLEKCARVRQPVRARHEALLLVGNCLPCSGPATAPSSTIIVPLESFDWLATSGHGVHHHTG